MFEISTTQNTLWIGLIVISVLLLIGYYLSYRVTLLKTKHDFVPPIAFQAIGGLLMIPLAFISKQPLPFVNLDNHASSPYNYLAIVMFLFAGIFYAIHDRTQATVRKNVDVAVSGVIDLSVHIFLILFGILILDELVSFQTLLGIILIVIANFNVAYDFGSHKMNKYWAVGIVANLAYAIGILIDIDLSGGRNLPFYVMLSYLVGAIYVFFMSKFDERLTFKQMFVAIREDMNRKTMAWHLSTSFFSVFYTLTMLLSYRYGPISTTTALISTTVIFNTILSGILLGERKLFLLKITSAIVGVIGVVLVV